MPNLVKALHWSSIGSLSIWGLIPSPCPTNFTFVCVMSLANFKANTALLKVGHENTYNKAEILFL